MKKLLITIIFPFALSVATSSYAQTGILEQLDRAGAKQPRSASLAGPGEFPKDALFENQIQWYYSAINHASALGDTNRVIELYRSLIKITDTVGGNTAARARHQLASELHNAGFIQETIALREENKPYFKNMAGLRIANLGAAARIKISVFNDLEQARKDLQDMEAELKSASATAKEPEYVNVWLANYERTIALESRARGRFAESIAYYRGAVDRYQRYADNVERLNRIYKQNERREDMLIVRDGTIMEVAHSLRWMGRAVEAETTLRQLLSEQINRGARPLEISKSASALSYTLMNQGRWQEARKIQTRAEELLRGTGLSEASSQYIQVRSSLVPIYIGLKQWEDASRIYDEIVKRAEKNNLSNRRSFLWPEMTIVFLKLKKTDQAHDHAKRVLELESQQFGANSYRAREAQGFLAMTLKAQGKRQEAEALFRESVSRIIDPGRDLSGSGAAFLRVKVRHIVEDYLDLLAAELKKTPGNSPDNTLLSQAFWLSESVRGSTVQRAISGAAARFAASDPRLSELVREEQDLAISIEDLQRKIGELYSARLSREEAQKLSSAMRQQISTQEDKRKKILDQISREFPEYARLVRPQSPSIQQMSEILKADEGYISIYVGIDKTFVSAVRSNGRASFHVAELTESDLHQAVGILRRSLDPGEVPLGKIPAFDFSVAYSLYDKLLRPVSTALEGAATWTVSTTGALGSLPLSLLVTAPYKANADPRLLFGEYKSAPWLNQKVAIAYTPSAAATVALRKLPPGSAARKIFFGIGDPQFGAQASASSQTTRGIKSAADEVFALRNLKIPRKLEDNIVGSNLAAETESRSSMKSSETRMAGMVEVARVADSQASSSAKRSLASTDPKNDVIADIPPLPDTREEIRAIATSLGADLEKDTLFGAAATRERVKTMTLSDRRIVAFATHGLIPGDMPGLNQPALTLAYSKDPRDSLLTLEDILKLKLDADWVVLSACNTGAADGLGTEAASGLGRGFFYAGSRALLLTHWPVESESARKLVTEIFSLYSKQTSRAQAVKQAAEALINSPGYLDPQSNRLLYSYAHPMFWAPYTLIGDAR